MQTPASTTRSLLLPGRSNENPQGIAHDVSRDWRLALAWVFGALLLRLLLSVLVPLLPDETYYWEWSRRLAPGYFDHPRALPG